jgi:deoxyribose-phosphate aldolase
MGENDPPSLDRNPGIQFDIGVLHHTNLDNEEIRARVGRVRNTVPTGTKQRVLALGRVISVMDLTSLSERDTATSVNDLCVTAARPIAGEVLETLSLDPSLRVAAVCVFHQFASTALHALRDTNIRVAAVAGGFPEPLPLMDDRLRQIRDAVSGGVDEVDLVITRDLARREDWKALYEEVVTLRTAAGNARVKIILAAGDLKQHDIVWKASMTCMMAGADFIKTSTGHEQVNATLPVGVVMANAIRRYEDLTGCRVGLKPAGGIRKAGEAMEWLRLAELDLGEPWTAPLKFRIGASSLLEDVRSELHASARNW